MCADSAVYAQQVHSPYRDFFLQSVHGPVFTHTNCQQGHTSPGATGNRCVGYFWNMANASARDYFIENLVQPLAKAPMIDGIFYDAFNYGYDIPEVRSQWEDRDRSSSSRLAIAVLAATSLTPQSLCSFRSHRA